MTTYTVVLALHNLIRWLILIVGVFALARAYGGWLGRREWANVDRVAGMVFSSALDIQLLLGLWLYLFLSPLTTTAFENFGNAMKSSGLRFFAVEHLAMMVLAIVFGHLGSMLSKRAGEAVKKHRAAAIWFTLAFVAILAAIPWQAERLLPRF